ncbi:4-(cytidine 5'-diphospho)-2-C-methyl-D-erythritol kinase [Candidatus Pelagibacter sp.]|jgi:4-diphosphocytidyl-2-C-methyl-D-erythritol kinase|nr:4-(cytidine 5'-diphospho)-2-C-methyl-D-erythritol kinase [Candidatus Pelagibacter sp.]MDC1140200.1 4-(cytidine 5'-diphospho)-2-C-methyl-D-erythritol kinase [Candidatus Pelagibacter sp.]
MNSFTIKSHAKINLALNVTGKKIKLHKIESLISFIGLHDLINLKNINKKDHKVIFKGKFAKNIGKRNTVTNLLKLLDNKNLLNNKKFEIKIIKNIPQEAGMGGGSMNAASLIDFFINKEIIKIKKNDLKVLTNEIGSDVILGIKPSNTILSHNGDIKKYNKDIKFYTLVVKPSFGCSTKYIYSKIKIFSKPQFSFPKAKMFKAKYLKTLNNDLENIAFKKYPKLKKIKLFLSNTPNNVFVRMSGSGSSIIAYFDSRASCGKAYTQFKRKFSSHWCIISKTI